MVTFIRRGPVNMVVRREQEKRMALVSCKDGGTLTLELAAGPRTVQVSGGGMSREATIAIADVSNTIGRIR